MTLILLTGIAVTNAQEERLSGTSGQQQSLVAKTTAASDLLAKRLKRLTAPRSYEPAEGSRVTISSDAPLNDYTAHRSDDRFHVVIPQGYAN
jgi:CBS-domain-containing membrane protein